MILDAKNVMNKILTSVRSIKKCHNQTVVRKRQHILWFKPSFHHYNNRQQNLEFVSTLIK